MSDLHPPGLHEAEITDHGFGQSTTGSDQFVVSYKTAFGSLFGYFYLTDKAVQYTLQKVRNMGFQGDDLSELGDGSVLRGNRVLIDVRHETYEGVSRAKINGVYPLGWEPGVKKDAAVAANAKRFNSILKTVPKVEDEAVPF